MNPAAESGIRIHALAQPVRGGGCLVVANGIVAKRKHVSSALVRPQKKIKIPGLSGRSEAYCIRVAMTGTDSDIKKAHNKISSVDHSSDYVRRQANQQDCADSHNPEFDEFTALMTQQTVPGATNDALSVVHMVTLFRLRKRNFSISNNFTPF